MNTTIRTALYRLHLEMGAKMQPFAGYLLPMHYKKGIIHEHLHTRGQAGFFDISHMGQLLVSATTAAQALENMTPSDITGLREGQQKYTVLTNTTGGIIDDIIITRLDAKLSVIVNACCKQKDLLHLQTQLSENCVVEELNHHSLFALQGPLAATVIGKFCDAADRLTFMTAMNTEIDNIACVISRCGYTGEDGFEISVAGQHAEQLARILLADERVEPIGLGARNTLRLEAGLCLYGHELSESITPIEAGLQWIIKKQHNHFPGAEIILQQLQQKPDWIRVGLITKGKVPIRDGAEIINSKNGVIGNVTSGSFSPSLGHPIAMARLDNNRYDPDDTLYTRVRNNKIPLDITPLPFVRHNYYRHSRN